MNEENKKLCPFTVLKECCGNDCALYSEKYNVCCIANFGEEMLKALIRALEISRMTR